MTDLSGNSEQRWDLETLREVAERQAKINLANDIERMIVRPETILALLDEVEAGKAHVVRWQREQHRTADSSNTHWDQLLESEAENAKLKAERNDVGAKWSMIATLKARIAELEALLDLERLSELEHDQWVNWSQNIWETETLSDIRLERWKAMWVPYSELSEEIKEYDRKWARKVRDD